MMILIRMINFTKYYSNPSYPVQARELTGLQSLLQNQVESFGKHIFKEGSMVILQVVLSMIQHIFLQK